MIINRDIKIRGAVPPDMDDLLVLLRELFTIEADFNFDKERQRRGLSLMLDCPDEHCCVKVAEFKGKIVAMCTAQILISTSEGGIVALVEDMVVYGPYRRMGIGKILIKSIEKWALDRGVTRLQLLADRANSNALEFYNRIGWLPTQLICVRKKLI